MALADIALRDAWIERVLGLTVPRPAGRDEPAADVIVTAQSVNVSFAKLKLKWNAARAKAASQLAALENAVLADYEDPETVSSTAEIIGVTTYFGEGLGNTLDDLYSAEDQRDKARLRDQAATIIRDYEMYIENDPLVAHIEANPFTTVELKSGLLPPLHEITVALGLLDQVVLAA